MADAGYAEGFEVTMDCPNDRYVNDERICQASASMLAKIGVKVNVLAQTKSKYFAKVLAAERATTPASSCWAGRLRPSTATTRSRR